MRNLPKPALLFTIPSLHDNKLLECRLYLSKGLATTCSRAAIIAHPYAPLGGSYDDPIVSLVGAEILGCGWIVMTFNFRGAGGSQGRTSWTGNAECADYASVASFLIRYLSALQNDNGNKKLDIIFGGYSYGSMIAINSKLVPSILNPLDASNSSSAAAEIVAQAEKLVTKTQRHSEMGHAEAQDKALSSSNQNFDFLINTYYLLVSPLLPPTSTLIALPLLSGDRHNHQSVKKLETAPVLAVYGEHDGFTSSKKLDAWVQRLSSTNPQFEGAKIGGAGHFWNEHESSRKLIKRIHDWLLKLHEDLDPAHSESAA